MSKAIERLWCVVWKMDVVAKDARSAATKAKRHQLKLTGASLFAVRDDRGHVTVVNLDDK